MIAKLPAEHREVADWLYKVTSTPTVAVILWGTAQMIACEHQDWSFWQVLCEVKERIVVVEVGPDQYRAMMKVQ